MKMYVSPLLTVATRGTYPTRGSFSFMKDGLRVTNRQELKTKGDRLEMPDGSYVRTYT
jgi:hypothetical protein